MSFSIVYFKSLFNIGTTGLIDIESRINLYDNIFLLIASFILATPLLANLINKIYIKFEFKSRRILLMDTLIYIFILVISTVYLVNSTYNPFIYFRF